MNLEEARSAIATIDAGIISLIAKRQALSAAIADEKMETGAPVRDEAQRAKVILRAGETAAASGLDRAAVESIFGILVEMNERAQEERLRG